MSRFKLFLGALLATYSLQTQADVASEYEAQSVPELEQQAQQEEQQTEQSCDCDECECAESQRPNLGQRIGGAVSTVGSGIGRGVRAIGQGTKNVAVTAGKGVWTCSFDGLVREFDFHFLVLGRRTFRGHVDVTCNSITGEQVVFPAHLFIGGLSVGLAIVDSQNNSANLQVGGVGLGGLISPEDILNSYSSVNLGLELSAIVTSVGIQTGLTFARARKGIPALGFSVSLREIRDVRTDNDNDRRNFSFGLRAIGSRLVLSPCNHTEHDHAEHHTEHDHAEH